MRFETTFQTQQFTTMIRAAQKIATRLHEGQQRLDGSPYIHHPEAVAAPFLVKPSVENGIRGAIAWLHDTMEDTDVTAEELVRMLIEEGVDNPFAARIVEGVVALTRTKEEPYVAAIARVAINEDAIYVKIQDLMHNLSTLPEDKKQKRDKYLMALAILKTLQTSPWDRELFWRVTIGLPSTLRNAASASHPQSG